MDGDVTENAARKALVGATLLAGLLKIFLYFRQMKFILTMPSVPATFSGKISASDFDQYRRLMMLSMVGAVFGQFRNLAITWARIAKGFPAYLWTLTSSYAETDTNRLLVYTILQILFNTWLFLIFVGIIMITTGHVADIIAFCIYAVHLVILSTLFTYILLTLTKHFGPEVFLYLAVPLNVLEMVNVVVMIQFVVPRYCIRLPAKVEESLRPTADRVNYPISRVCMIPEDIVEIAPNAAYVGLLGIKIIMMTESLFNAVGLTDAKSVLAHELGHWARGHMAIGVIKTLITTIVTCFISALCYGNQTIFRCFRFTDADPPHPFLGVLIGWEYVIPLVTSAIQGVATVLSYFCEYDADHFAVNLGLGIGLKNALVVLVSGMKRFAFFDSWFAAWLVGHPDVLDRVYKILS